MNRKLAQLLVDVCEDFDIDARIYENYSGRGMCGAVTTGIVMEDAIANLPFMLYNCAQSIVKLQEAGELPLELDDSFRTDSMGRDSIVY